MKTLPPRRSRLLTHTASFAVLACLAAGWAGDPAVAQATAGSPKPAAVQDRTVEIDRIFAWAKPDAPGCAVAVSLNGKQIASRAYGSADLEREVKITPDSVFDIGSTHKQFVAAAILLLAEDGKLKLTDDVRKYVPQLPDYGKTITIDHLLTHTSGIRDWTALLPFSGVKTDALTAILHQRGTNFAPGEEWAYSNSNYVLLKEIVAKASGMPFRDFARTRLFEPLGMKASSYSVDMLDVVKNRAMAYEKQGQAWRLSMRLDDERGGGGVLSTASDLLIWHDALASKRLSAFVSEKIVEPARLNNGRKLQYTRGLIVDAYRGTKQVWHSGGSAGYSAWLGSYPEYGLAVAATCNSDGGGANARRVADLYLPATLPLPPAPPPPNATADPAVAAKAGLFVTDGGDTLRLGVERGLLRVVAGPPMTAGLDNTFRPLRADPFFMSQDEFEIRFLSVDEFELKSMEGKTTRYRRASTWSPTETDLKAVAGRYESEDLRTVFAIAPGRNGLTATLEHDPERSLPVQPIYRDAFQTGNMTMRFVRDKSGKVIALDYTNPMFRNLRLTRIAGS